jgi:AraC-like DNA-binding protein
MLSSTTGVFREPADVQMAMQEYGCANLMLIASGSFRTRLTRIALHRLHLLTAEESLARIAFFSIPNDAILVSFSIGDGLPPLWGGTALRSGEIVTLSAGQSSHTRSTSHCRWGAILLPGQLLLSYARKITDDVFVLPSGVHRWRPSTKAYRRLVRLHISATCVANSRSGTIITSGPARTLEHELIDAVIACLSGRPMISGNRAMARHATIMTRFEDLLTTNPNRALTSAEICVALNVSERTLRARCDKHLGMGSNYYMRLRRLQLVHCALRGADPASTCVTQIAVQHGFIETGRFAGAYRARFGELPSVTLHRDLSP